MTIPIGGEIELVSPPKDGISAIKFGNTSNNLLSSSWDAANVAFDGALLDCCFGEDDRIAFTGGLNRQVSLIDWPTLHITPLGTHDDAVRALVRCSNTKLLFSGSWDRTLTAWDTTSLRRTAHLSLPEKVYTMDCGGEGVLVVGMADRKVQIYDTRRLDAPLQTRESALRHQTRCIRLFPDGRAFAISSIEGRVGVEYVNQAEQDRNFAFKCHRAPAPGKEADLELVYPVNALAFHPQFGTFCTGGSDGVVCVWDPQSKKRIRAYPRYKTSISSLTFSRDGSLLAISSSYCYEEGEKDHPPDSIHVRALEENELRGKSTV